LIDEQDRRLGIGSVPLAPGAAGFAPASLMFVRRRRPGRPRSQAGQTARL